MRARRAVRTACAAVLVSAVAALGLPYTAMADWPIYGHDLANSRDAGVDGPSPSQVASMPRSWTFNASTGDFTGTPVVANGVLVAGNNGGWVYALDAVTGKVRWSRNLGSQINGSAAIDGGTAFVPVAHRGAPRLVALSLSDGSVRWSSVLTSQADAS